MEFATFVRKPFVVEAVEITEDNIEEISKFVGTLKRDEEGKPYINVNRMLFPNLFKVFPGFWLTKLDDQIRCYSQIVFERQFIRSNAGVEDWLGSLNEYILEETL